MDAAITGREQVSGQGGRDPRRVGGRLLGGVVLRPGPEEPAQPVALGARYDVGVQVRHRLADLVVHRDERPAGAKPGLHRDGHALHVDEVRPDVGRRQVGQHLDVRPRHHQHVAFEDRPVVEKGERRQASTTTGTTGNVPATRRRTGTRSRRRPYQVATVTARLSRCTPGLASDPHDLRLRDARHPRRAGARAANRRGGAADLPDLHVRAGRRRRARGWATSTARTANPTRDALQECLAALEGGRRGLAFASGLAAEDTLLRTVCQPGDHVVIPDDAYGGTYRLFAKVAAALGSGLDRGADLRRRRRAGRGHDQQTKIIWVETPTNPLLGIADIAALAGSGPRPRRAAGRRQHVRQPVPAAAARARRRRGRPLHDQVRRRPLRRGRRRAGRRGRGARRGAGLPPERDGRGQRALRRLADAARRQDPGRTDGPPLRQRRADRGVPDRHTRR